MPDMGRCGQKFVWAVPSVGDGDRRVRADAPQDVDVVDVCSCSLRDNGYRRTITMVEISTIANGGTI